MGLKKPKVILFDVDGVLIHIPHYFSQELENQGRSNATESLNSFFREDIARKCSEGKADAMEAIVPSLKKLDWEGSAESYFKQQFEFEAGFLDKEFISLIQNFRKQNIKCYLGTDQEKNRAKFLLENMKFNQSFDGHFISSFIGFRKCHDDFWIHVLENLKKEFPNIDPSEIAFFDDIQNNVDVANKHGIQAFLFTDMEKFGEDLKRLGVE
ncbi:HAD hydrolase-like protein [bacterium]|nr:HAD hydrolase-like protein [bacterium]MBT6754233.1 HAD hydrolase-like protein [bacterium]MBT7037559.1 HAD hydrolase-like protein [bacterium]MBT7432061.1 HAD hydrolase-like protein [bacterium]MBT7992933.1 HAD hydrolase-like protein [bacterium]